MRTVRLSEEEIAGALARLPQWTRVGEAISRTFAFGSFAAAMAFVNGVADAAERRDHHPDMDIRYDHVTLALTTHFVKGLTAKDFTLAAACDALADGGQP